MMVETIKVKTSQRNQLVDITSDITSIVKKAKTREGMLFIFCPHTTAAVTVNENNDPSVGTDISNTLSTLVPHHAHYSHTEGNADAHIKAATVGSSRALFIRDGRIAFGSWQGIFLCEFDGPRTREVWIKIITE
jgi:secondary thiamine-phosphate synthase enzyme